MNRKTVLEEASIPEGWQKVALGEFMEFKNGINADKSAYGQGTKFVNVMDIFRNNFLKKDDITGLVRISDKQLSEYSVVHGDILFNRTSETREEIAYSTVYTDKETITFGGFVIRGRQKKNLLLPAFAGYCFKNETTRKEMIRRSQGAVRANIGQKDLNMIPILVPPKHEQEKIVQILSRFDTAIEKTEALITGKQKQFEWLLKRLIYDQQKNPECLEMKLESVAEITTGQSAPQNRNYFSSSGIPFIRAGKLESLIQGIPENAFECIDEEKGKMLKLRLFPKNTIIFAKSGMSATIPRIYSLKTPCFIVSHLCAVIAKKRIEPSYLEYFLNAYHPYRLIQGEGFPSIKASEVMKMKIKIPPVITQKQVANMLDSAKHEINLLKELAERYRIQKHGLMKKLLTGKWRAQL